MKGEGGVTSCIGFTFTSSSAGPGWASQAWIDSSRSSVPAALSTLRAGLLDGVDDGLTAELTAAEKQGPVKIGGVGEDARRGRRPLDFVRSVRFARWESDPHQTLKQLYSIYYGFFNNTDL